MSKFDLRRASKDQLDRMNDDIKAGKVGKKYTIYKSGGLDFILTENTGIESKENKASQVSSPLLKISRGVNIKFNETSRSKERETPLEFNFETL